MTALLKVYPLPLDASHHPHITMAQRFVRTADLDKLYAALGKVFASANLPGLKLEAFKCYCIPNKDLDLGLSGIVAKPTPELLKLQEDVIVAVTPFTATDRKQYKLRLPSDIPAKLFWSLLVYETQTRLQLRS